MRYNQQINSLLDSLIRAFSTAIDERSPYNANHTKNMVRCGETFLDWMDRTGHPLRMAPEKRRTFLMSVWLHDVGKLTVPLEVMDKPDRLGPAISDIVARFRVVALLDRIAFLEGRIRREEWECRKAQLERDLAFIRRINGTGFLPDEDLEAVQNLGRKSWTDEAGEEHPLLTESELVCLSIRKGTLTEEERAMMQSHVTSTSKILGQVSFPKMYAETPLWASEHHELLNGRGYPRRLQGNEIPWEVRLLTILDIFDALTARDRPYKKAMPVSRALSILHSMVEEGAIDGEVLALFEESKAWEDLI
ncbi:MAG: hypothetical protein IJ705_02690 [Oscillospiraceae bacterium]|nr:hypothetical protein [Oscillospiraceae bacterium]